MDAQSAQIWIVIYFWFIAHKFPVYFDGLCLDLQDRNDIRLNKPIILLGSDNLIWFS